MVGLSLRKKCHLCGTREGLVPCVVCSKLTCQIHNVGGTCHDCLEKATFSNPDTKPVAEETSKSRSGDVDNLVTRLKTQAEPMTVLSDLYLLVGGRPGSRRSTTLMGSLHLDQNKQTLMFDRQVARRINATSFVRIRSPGLGEVETRPFLGNPTRRLAHDQIVRMVDLVSISRSDAGIQVIGGDPLLETVELDEEMACPNCGSWREICFCRDKPYGRMPASEYFRKMIGNRLRQKKIGLRMGGGERDEVLRASISRWESALDRI